MLEILVTAVYWAIGLIVAYLLITLLALLGFFLTMGIGFFILSKFDR